MCGISIYLGPDKESNRSLVNRSIRLMNHRGPDDRGVVISDDGIAIGHTRLSIVDLSAAGHQPMTSPDGRFVITYNGEIYNHRSLRDRYCRGWEFRGSSDTETLLALYALKGADVFAELVGMWAFGIWDSVQKKLVVCRDRYGQKPLYWRRFRDGSLGLASEFRPLLIEGEQNKFFSPAVAEYLSTGNYGHLGDKTFFDGIYSLPPGSFAEIRTFQDTIKPVAYWRFPSVPFAERRPYDLETKKRFRSAFEEAVQSQLMSDVTLGATLSGGLDSTAVVGAIAANSESKIHVFSAQCSGSKNDETQYVEAVRSKWGSKLDVHYVQLKAMRLQDSLANTIRIQEEPIGDPSMSAHGMLMDKARDLGVKVVLGGQGSDEILFGYGFMGTSLISNAIRLGKLSWALREGRAWGLKSRGWLRTGLSAFMPETERKMRMSARKKYGSWLTRELMLGAEACIPDLSSCSDAAAVQLEAVERTALPHLVHYDDRSGMARSIEGRMPFLDHRLADVISTIDQSAFLHDGMLKWILRDACGDLMPDEVRLRRDKVGFHTPLHEMLIREIDWVESMILDEFGRQLGAYQCDMIGIKINSIRTKTTSAMQYVDVFRTLAFRMWAEEFNVSTTS
jgi:asparagine synthase (glutamine-hydrolysing)